MRQLEPRPDVAILGVAGRANLDGRAFQGSMAEFQTRQLGWLGEPATVVWCLHDQAPLAPWSIDACAATAMVEQRTRSRVLELRHAVETPLPL